MIEHPTVPELAALASGTLEAAGRGDDVRAHCMVCDDCRLMLDTVVVLRRLAGVPTAMLRLPAAGSTVQ